MLEEFIQSQQLYIINEESQQTTFRSTRGSSNIDITVTNRRMLSTVTDWEISDQESCSDHSITRHNTGHRLVASMYKNDDEVKYKVNKAGLTKLKNNLMALAKQKAQEKQTNIGPATLDKILSERVAKGTDPETMIDEFYDVLEEACRSSFQTTSVNKTKSTRRTVHGGRGN